MRLQQERSKSVLPECGKSSDFLATTRESIQINGLAMVCHGKVPVY